MGGAVRICGLDGGCGVRVSGCVLSGGLSDGWKEDGVGRCSSPGADFLPIARRSLAVESTTLVLASQRPRWHEAVCAAEVHGLPAEVRSPCAGGAVEEGEEVLFFGEGYEGGDEG
jgi:hypothetical protein